MPSPLTLQDIAMLEHMMRIGAISPEEGHARINGSPWPPPNQPPTSTEIGTCANCPAPICESQITYPGGVDSSRDRFACLACGATFTRVSIRNTNRVIAETIQRESEERANAMLRRRMEQDQQAFRRMQEIDSASRFSRRSPRAAWANDFEEPSKAAESPPEPPTVFSAKTKRKINLDE